MPPERIKAFSPQEPTGPSAVASTHLDEHHSDDNQKWPSPLPHEAFNEILEYLAEVVVERGPIPQRALAAGAFDALTGLSSIALSAEVPKRDSHESLEDDDRVADSIEAMSGPLAQLEGCWDSPRPMLDIVINEILKWLAQVVAEERAAPVRALAACAFDCLSGLIAFDWPTDYAERNMQEASYFADGAVEVPAVRSVVILMSANGVGDQRVN